LANINTALSRMDCVNMVLEILATSATLYMYESHDEMIAIVH